MAPNDPWPLMASPSHSKGSSKGRGNNGNKKNNIKEHQQNILKNLKEMFQSAVEDDVIVSVASSCNWEHQACIDALINISSTVEIVENKKTKSPTTIITDKKITKKNNDCHNNNNDINDLSKMTKQALKKQQEELKKFEKIKKNIPTKSRMGSFRGSISKLESSSSMTHHSPLKNDITVGNTDNERSWEHNNPRTSPSTQNTWRRENYQGQSTEQQHENDDNNNDTTITTTTKINNDSLCGLKVHYKTLGNSDTSSDDDDADVVIEEEINTINIPSTIKINSSQFLSSTTSTTTQSNINQKLTQLKLTKSPPHTPKISLYQSTIEKIKKLINNNNKVLILVRGLPGSGKTTLSKSIIESTIGGDSSKYIYSADDYFITTNGTWKYDSSKIADAHATTQKKVLDALKHDITPIIIDNTNLQAWEMRPYATMAVQRGYIIEIIDIDTPWSQNVNELSRKNNHNVPKEKIRTMMNRYEHGLTGQKLCDYFGLKYPDDNSPNLKLSPPVINEIDVLSAEDIIALENLSGTLEQEELNYILDNNNSSVINEENNTYIDYLKELRDRKESQSSVEDSEKKSIESTLDDHHFLLLGAIGSERKTSLVPQIDTSPNNETIDDKIIDDNNDNDDDEVSHSDDKDNILLSKCWDFTLMKDGEEIHSCGNKIQSPVSPSEMKKQDCEFIKKNNDMVDEESTLKVVDNKNQPMQHAINEFLKELAEGYNKTQGLDKVPIVPNTSSVVITEIIDNIENKISDEKIEDTLDAVDNLNDQQNPIDNIELNEENIEIIDKSDDETGVASIKVEKDDDYDENISELACKDKYSELILDATDSKLLDSDIFLEIEESSGDVLTLDSYLKLIKKSIPQQSNTKKIEELIEQQINNLIEAKKIDFNSAITDDVKKQIIEIFNEAIFTYNSELINIPVAEIRAAMDSTDDDVKKIKAENDDSNLASLECVVLKEDHFESDDIKSISDNNSQIIDEKNDNIIDNNKFKTPKKHVFICEDGKEPDDSDNINRITWTESPFPIDDIDTLKPIHDEVIDKVVVMKNDVETNTTYYDFNVAYVGGTSESGYHVLNAFSRQINDVPSPQQQPKRSPSKLMFDKSSMTGEINSENDDDNDDEKINRLPELIELFPHIPNVYLHEIYEKVDKNFDWAVELLLEGVPEYIPFEKTSSSTKNSSTSDSPATTMPEEHDNNVDVNNDDEHTEETSSLTSRSASLDVLIDTKSSPTSDTDTSSPEILPKDVTTPTNDLEETMELNLGFDFIHALEKKFGDADFHQTDGFLPVVQITKSMGETLYALWIESMCQQLNSRQNLLDEMITKDAVYAENLERQENIEIINEKNTPNIDEIIDMEIALASVENERKSISKRESNDEMILRLSKQILQDSHPDIDSSTFSAILDVHNGDYHEAFKSIELNTGKKILPCYINKQKNLMDRVKKETKIPNIVYPKCTKEPMSYKAVLTTAARTSRKLAERKLSLRLQNINKAQEMYHKGLPEVAEYYSNLATLQMRNNDTDIINDKGTDDLLDLHYLSVVDALNAVDEFVDFHIDKLNKSENRLTTLSLVTGWGARSNGGGKLKPAVIKHLTKRSIKFVEDNPGCLNITLRRKKQYQIK
ncbi:hypothetical protein HCN44_008555 [Aphidius gifuensis]|uniref:Smr domain-containing protein n=1 Tax=Aphidius gifuensis TaxID=684658 RepID=A0A834XSB0_APHGI|nr:uncharacterized protein LOC122858275 [Aphidius gifuensis]KAF7989881.1 hypothetical protein HCN44_008555 [Aphidius gifuensis]